MLKGGPSTKATPCNVFTKCPYCSQLTIQRQYAADHFNYTIDNRTEITATPKRSISKILADSGCIASYQKASHATIRWHPEYKCLPERNCLRLMHLWRPSVFVYRPYLAMQNKHTERPREALPMFRDGGNWLHRLRHLNPSSLLEDTNITCTLRCIRPE